MRAGPADGGRRDSLDGPPAITIGGPSRLEKVAPPPVRSTTGTPDPTDLVQDAKDHVAGDWEMRRARAVVVQEVEGPSVERQPEFARNGVGNRDDLLSLGRGECLGASRVLPTPQAANAVVVEPFDPCADGGRTHPKFTGDLLDGLLSRGQQHDTGATRLLVCPPATIGRVLSAGERDYGRHVVVARPRTISRGKHGQSGRFSVGQLAHAQERRHTLPVSMMGIGCINRQCDE